MDQGTFGLLQQAVSMLLQIVLLAVVAGLVWLRNELKNYIAANTTIRERELIADLGKAAFSYAETVYSGLDGPGKLNEATKYMLDVLEGMGKEVPMKDIRAAIETAWLEDRRRSGVPAKKPNTYEVR
ncbi:phage holin, LLH family [Effusibacillus lacus]|uniref:Phage holin n=1 Tax=Effusibacillus lacus TaxID=1348429 RepID=A0A292YJX0_9BACL|nr:phage holin, LLH family [Effusibacillus lacus]TCS73653.1 superfamily 6 holin (LLH) [Effusibacillus lacus]GAX89456.1 hypothetical protein [Effusibacillus lacus]